MLEDKENSCVSEFETDWVFSNAREGSIKLEGKENSFVSEFETDWVFSNAREGSIKLEDKENSCVSEDIMNYEKLYYES